MNISRFKLHHLLSGLSLVVVLAQLASGQDGELIYEVYQYLNAEYTAKAA